MKLAMFTTKEGYITWLENEIEAITKNGLKQAVEAYDKALNGYPKEEWLAMNNLTNADESDREYAWSRYLLFCGDQVKYLKRKIKKYQREISKTLAMA